MRFLLVICFISSLAFGQDEGGVIQKKYEECIQKADHYYGLKDYKRAREYYSEAISLRPDERHAKDKVVEIERILSYDAAQKEIEFQYQKLLSVANDNYLNCDLEKAYQLYSRANQMKPDDPIPAERLKNIDAIGDAYDQFMDEADSAFAQRNYLIATSKLKSAERLMPCEKYIADAILVLKDSIKDMKVEVQNNVVFKRYKDHTMKDSVMSIEFRVVVINNSDQKIPDLGVTNRSENLNFYVNDELSNPISLSNGMEVIEGEKVISPGDSAEYYVSWVLLPDSGIIQSYGNNFTVQWEYCGIKSEVKKVDIQKRISN